jgi:hypothetical protein
MCRSHLPPAEQARLKAWRRTQLRHFFAVIHLNVLMLAGVTGALVYGALSVDGWFSPHDRFVYEFYTLNASGAVNESFFGTFPAPLVTTINDTAFSSSSSDSPVLAATASDNSLFFLVRGGYGADNGDGGDSHNGPQGMPINGTVFANLTRVIPPGRWANATWALIFPCVDATTFPCVNVSTWAAVSVGARAFVLS